MLSSSILMLSSSIIASILSRRLQQASLAYTIAY